LRLRLGAAILVALAAVACGNTGPTPSPSAPVATVAPPSVAATSSPAASPAASPTSGSTSSGSAPGSGSPVAAEPALLDLLRSGVAQLTMTYDPDTTGSVRSDPSVARDARSIAIGLATPAGQASPEEFVIANVVRLKDPSRDEEWFRSWRDTYDEAACQQAGGVQGNAETKIGEQTVFIGSCLNGVLTYHVRLENGGVVVSLTSIGPSRLGERLLRATIAP
jgi:hypothetical protein